MDCTTVITREQAQSAGFLIYVCLSLSNNMASVYDTFCQCKLRSQSGVGNRAIVSWIPKRYAAKGVVISLMDPDGRWSIGWEILEVWGDRPYDEANARSRDHTQQRKASDV